MIGLDEVRAAAARLTGHLSPTPLVASRVLSEIADAEIAIKFENLQFTASFKERGALNRLLTLSPEERARGVCAMSAGNHAQAVAYHAHRLAIAATIVMPTFTPFVKVDLTRRQGAEVVLAGETLADAGAEALRLAAARGLTFVHPYDDELVIAGQGTVALEILEARSDIDTLVVPIGGGGLISGIATAAKAIRPDIRVVGVQAASYPSMLCALKGEALVGDGNTIAEGIAVKYPGKFTTAIVRERVDEILTVDEPALEHAIALYLNVEKTVAEGAGAAALAAVLTHRDKFRGRKIALLLSGGNIDPRLLASVLMRELVRERRIVTVRVPIHDRPGALARITAAVAGAGANIIEVRHQRTLLALPAKDAALELTFEAHDHKHTEAVIAAMAAAGFHATVVLEA
ncbi:MAG TPA: threonine ammonia-lyase [Magnetospirillaceae bacterium]